MTRFYKKYFKTSYN